MCELLIRIKAKSNVDPDFASPVAIVMNTVHRSAKILHAGDVVVVCPDGWGWTHYERNNPDWRIVKVPDMTLEEGQALTAREVGDGTPGVVRRRRHFAIDPLRLRSEMTKRDLMAAVSQKPKLKYLTTI